MRRFKGLLAGVILAIAMIVGVGNGFSATVETPMVEDLDGGGYDIFNVTELDSTSVVTEDIITKSPWVDVRAYGAVGDGATDDTTAIQNAINSGKDVYFPETGVFKVSAPIDLSTSNQILFGSGYIKSNANPCIKISANIEGLTIRDLTLENLGAAGGGRDDAGGIWTDTDVGVERSRFLNLTLTGFGIGMSLEGSSSTNFFTSLSDDLFGGTVTMEGSPGRNLIQGCEIRDTLAAERIGTGGGHGIFCRGGYFQIIGNRIQNMQGGIIAPNYGVIANNVILNAWDDNGIYAYTNGNLTISGNYIENTERDGIALSAIANVAVTGNVIINANQGGIRLQQAEKITITGNTIKSTDNRTDNFIRGYASVDHTGSKDIVISGNVFEGPLAGTSNPIMFRPGTTKYENILITNNIFRDIDTTALTDANWNGPYAIINIKDSVSDEKPVFTVVKDNVFNEVEEVALRDSGVPYYIKGATEESGNLFTHKAGWSDYETYDTGKTRGYAIFRCTTVGLVSDLSNYGIISNIEKNVAGSTGEYTITFTKPVVVADFSWSASGANAPFTIRADIPNPQTPSGFDVEEVIMTFYDASGTAVWPNWSSYILVSVTSFRTMAGN